ncbi:mannose-6-phosphate isomerase-like protein (cupin superfamily) [Streptacidiphilus sp. MAP12-20]|uniref:cupin n=1 Tax=Streptacidiphilus sp. MAP12-20 TaxID=3156299 RepID=UPI003512FD2D
MTTTPIPTCDLFVSALQIHPDTGVQPAEGSMAGGDQGAWQIAAFRAQTDADLHADHWELHPDADEVVCCVTGTLRLYLRPTEPGAAEEMVRLPAGVAAVVPRGRWHRLELDAPSDLMTITPRHGTRHEKRTV